MAFANRYHSDKQGAIYEIQQCLLEWGVDPSKNKQHDRFYKSIVAIVEDCFPRFSSSSSSNYQDHDRGDDGDCLAIDAAESNTEKEFSYACFSYQALPEDPLKAVEMVLRLNLSSEQDSEGKLLSSWCAAVATNSDQQQKDYRPPYKVDRRGRKFNIKKKWAFRTLSDDDLDPFRRLVCRRVASSSSSSSIDAAQRSTPSNLIECNNKKTVEYFFKKWIIAETPAKNDKAILDRVAFEAIVASHAIHHGSSNKQSLCPHCFQHKCLKWRGATSSWGTIICISCQCVFEIKLKSDMERVEGAAETARFLGDSFVAYHKLHHTQNGRAEEKGWKHYVWVVNTKPSYEYLKGTLPGTKHLCWAVDMAEIQRVSPLLNYRVFGRTGSSSREDLTPMIKSNIFIDTNELTSLFKIPLVEVQYKPILVKILTEDFPGHITIDEHGGCKLSGEARHEENEPYNCKGRTPRNRTIDLSSVHEKFHRLSIESSCNDNSSNEEDNSS